MDWNRLKFLSERWKTEDQEEEEVRDMKMMKACSSVLAMATVILLAAPTAKAAVATVGADLNSAYVWRGISLNQDPVIQPSVDVVQPLNSASAESYWGVNVWGNWDIGDDDGRLPEDHQFSEVDLTIFYKLPVEQVDLTIGNITYLFPNQTTDEAPFRAVQETRELYLSLEKSMDSEKVQGTFSGKFNFYYDWDEIDDYYGDVEVTYSHPATEDLSVDLSALIGFAGSDFAAAAGGTSSGFFNWNTTLELNYSVNEAVSVGGFIAYTDTADTSVLPPEETADTDVYGGLNAYYTF